MQIPTHDHAESLLQEAAEMNPGPWVGHSRTAAEAARRIAARLDGMDPEAAYVLGLLHDIGRRCGVHGMRHITDGYYFLEGLGYSSAARICLTHSFPLQEPRSMLGWDGTREDEQFVYCTIEDMEYDDYDRLIQLVDALAFPGGCCLIEKRMVDVVMRYGFNAYTTRKWQAHFAILRNFEECTGGSIYALLPNIIHTTFGENFSTAPGTSTAK